MSLFVPSLGLSLVLGFPKTIPSVFDSDAAAYFIVAGITDDNAKTSINALIVGVKELFDWTDVFLMISRADYNAAGPTLYKLGGASWGNNGTLQGTPTLGANGVPMTSGSSQYLTLGSWGAPFTGGIYCGTVHAPVSVSGATRGLSIENTGGNPIGGLHAPFSDGNIYYDNLHFTARVTGASGASDGDFHAWAGSSEGAQCWVDDDEIATGGGAASLNGTFNRVQVGREGTNIASDQTLAVTWAVADGTVDSAKHNSFLALLKATVAPMLPLALLAVIYSINVPVHGNGVEMTIDKPVSVLSAEGWTVTADGEQIPVSSVSQTGEMSWEVRFHNRWIAAGQTVTLAYAGTQLAPLEETMVDAERNYSQTTERAIEVWERRTAMSVHWNIATFGIYNAGGGQWAPGDIDPELFYPTGGFNADSFDNWIAVANSLDATALYVTAKHVDGYCMWDSTATPAHSLRASTAWWAASGFDVIGAFCSKVRAAGLKVGLYFSIWDRAFELENPEWTNEEYTAYIHAQLTELLDGRYGVIDELLIDAWAGINDYPDYVEVDYASTIALIRSLQPNILITNNNYERDVAKTELAIWEAGTSDPIPLSTTRYISRIWMTPTGDVNGWFDDPARRDDYLAASTQAAQAAVARSRGADVLFNISPDPSGLFDAQQISYAAELGLLLA